MEGLRTDSAWHLILLACSTLDAFRTMRHRFPSLFLLLKIDCVAIQWCDDCCSCELVTWMRMQGATYAAWVANVTIQCLSSAVFHNIKFRFEQYLTPSLAILIYLSAALLADWDRRLWVRESLYFGFRNVATRKAKQIGSYSWATDT